MHRLQREMDTNLGLAEVILQLSNRVAENDGSMGLLLDLNPVWRLAARMRAAGLSDFNWFRRPPYDWFFAASIMDLVGPEIASELDFKYRSALVDDILEESGGAAKEVKYQPFLLRLVARPEATAKDHRDLIEAAQRTPILTVVNTHPVPQPVTAPGSVLTAVSSSNTGTLGGYLRDTISDSQFAVTCGHVATHGDLASGGAVIGTVMHGIAPKRLTSGSRCHAGCGDMTELDVAFVDVGRPGHNWATNIADTLYNGDIVVMGGGKSGTQTYEVGALAVFHEIGGACWKDLIQLHAPTSGVLPASIRVATTRLPSNGDSGSWIVRDGTDWAGMVVASDKTLFGYALAAETIISRSNAEFSMDLELA